MFCGLWGGGPRDHGIRGWIMQSPCPRPRKGSRLSREPCRGGRACWSLPTPLPLLKAHRFSHSLERAGQEWLSAELAMGAHACESEGEQQG